MTVFVDSDDKTFNMDVRGTHKPTTVRRRLTMIGRAHQAAGFSPLPAPRS
jgi:hypothetical protein